MKNPIYDKVADAVNARTGYPCPKVPELIAILEFLFTRDEAELAVRMPMGFILPEDLAKDVGKETAEVKNMLENMADKALVFTQESEEGRKYVLVPLLPGTFEVQFMRGVKDEATLKLAKLFQDYFEAVKPLEEKNPRPYTSVPFARVIPVEQEIPAGVSIHPYDKVSEYIANSDLISIGTCYCRFFGELTGDPCGKPKENCFSFDAQAKFMIDRGFNKPVTKEEARRVLGEAEKAGLVHCSSNTTDVIQFICNCCSCHCGIMKSIQVADRPFAAAVSGFILKVNADACTGCGECVDRCQVNALRLSGDMVTMDERRCIGCGLCTSTCPSGALSLVLRENAPKPPLNQMELGAAMIASYQQQTQV